MSGRYLPYHYYVEAAAAALSKLVQEQIQAGFADYLRLASLILSREAPQQDVQNSSP